MGIRSLGYVVIETRDLEAWRRYGTEVLGLAEAASDEPDSLKLRLDDRPFRFLIRKGAAERFAAAGWEFASKADYEAGLKGLREAGVTVTPASAAEAKSRAVYELARCSDPAGSGLELYWGRFEDFQTFISPVGVRGFVTGDMGLGHVVLPAPAPHFDAVQDFYTKLLGFGLSDEQSFMLPGGPPEGLRVHFFHAENPRHHSVAFCEIPSETGLFHLMLEVHDVDDVGRAMDRAAKHEVKITASLGRHTNDRMLSVYMATPSGFEIEYGCEGWQIDWEDFVPTRSLAPDFWGHAYNRG